MSEMFSSKIIEVLFQSFDCILEYFLNSFTAFELILWIFLISFTVYIVYKIYSFLYVFGDEFREMKEIKLKKFKSFNRMSERPPDYPNGWIPVLESNELKVNQTKPVAAFGYELVVFRGPSGEAHVIDAFCPHLGAHFGIGAKIGQTESGKDCIQCPFHGWTFRTTDGLCVDIPEFESKSVETINAKLKIWKSLEVNDVIYVWYHSEDKEPDWEPDVIPQIQDKKWVCLGRTEYILDCHIQEIEENWTDLAHFVSVHRPLYYPINSMNRLQKFLQNLISFGIRTNWISVAEPKPYNAMASIDALSKICGYETWSMNFSFKQVGPATLVISYETDILGGISGALVQYVNPVQPNKLRFILRNYCDTGFRARLFAKVLWVFELFMIERDMLIWNNKRFVKNAKYTKSDKSIAQFRRWYSQYYSQNSYRSSDW